MSSHKGFPDRWFSKVRDDMSVIVDALAWYDVQLQEGYKHVRIEGNLEAQNQFLPGLFAYYDSIHTDIDMILYWMERKLDGEKNIVFKTWMEDPPFNAKMSATDLKKLVTMDDGIATLNEVVDEVKYVYKSFGSLMDAFNQKGYSLNNIVKIRTANMEEVLL